MGPWSLCVEVYVIGGFLTRVRSCGASECWFGAGGVRNVTDFHGRQPTVLGMIDQITC